MSKMSQHYMDLPYEEFPLEAHYEYEDDPEYLIWAKEQDDEDIIIQDGEETF